MTYLGGQQGNCNSTDKGGSFLLFIRFRALGAERRGDTGPSFRRRHCRFLFDLIDGGGSASDDRRRGARRRRTVGTVRSWGSPPPEDTPSPAAAEATRRGEFHTWGREPAPLSHTFCDR